MRPEPSLQLSSGEDTDNFLLPFCLSPPERLKAEQREQMLNESTTHPWDGSKEVTV